MVCMQGEFDYQGGMVESVGWVYNSQQLTSCYAKLAFELAQGSTGI